MSDDSPALPATPAPDPAKDTNPPTGSDVVDYSVSHAEAQKEERRRFHLFSAVALLCLLAGVIAISVFAGQSSCSRVSNVIWGVAMAASAAAMAVGVLVGYLFGVPRAPNGGQAATAYGVNTSLEQIADWVVKILVGLGLTQLREAPEGMVRLAKSFERAVANLTLADCPAACCSKATALSGVGQFGAALVLYFAVFGFLLGYAHMRLYLAPAFSDADKMLNKKMREAVKADQQAQKANVQAELTLKRSQDLDSVTKVMLDALYEPGSYGRAIDGADQFLATHGDPKDAGFWLRYACAWGQKAKASSADPPTYERAKQKALAAVRRMIELNGDSARGWARNYWDTDATGPGAENDLVAFRNDSDFIALLGHRRQATETTATPE